MVEHVAKSVIIISYCNGEQLATVTDSQAIVNLLGQADKIPEPSKKCCI